MIETRVYFWIGKKKWLIVNVDGLNRGWNISKNNSSKMNRLEIALALLILLN